MVIGALLREAVPHTEIRVDLESVDPRMVTLLVRHQTGDQRRGECEAGLALAERLSARLGGRVTKTDEGVQVALPVSVAGNESEDLPGVR
jgi:hypothetical protein